MHLCDDDLAILVDCAVIDHADDGHTQVTPDAEGDAEAEPAQHGDDVSARGPEACAVTQGRLLLLALPGSPILCQLDHLTCLLLSFQFPARQAVKILVFCFVYLNYTPYIHSWMNEIKDPRKENESFKKKMRYFVNFMHRISAEYPPAYLYLFTCLHSEGGKYLSSSHCGLHFFSFFFSFEFGAGPLKPAPCFLSLLKSDCDFYFHSSLKFSIFL